MVKKRGEGRGKRKKKGGGSQPPISWPEMVVKHHSSGWVSTLPYQLILGHDHGSRIYRYMWDCDLV